MFGKKDKETNFSSGGITLISGSTEIVGDIHFSGNLEIEGRVKGNVIAGSGSDARIRLLEKGVVEGEIQVPTVVINGHVTGDVHSSKHIELAAKGVVQGNVHYNVIEMVKGAQVNGNLVFSDGEKQTASSKASAGNKAPAPAKETPAAKPAAMDKALKAGDPQTANS